MLAIASAPSTGKQRLTASERDKLDPLVVEQTMDSVAASSDRNDKFDRWAMQLRGDPNWAGIQPRFKGKGSQYEDPITREHQMDVQSRLMQPLSADQWWYFNATQEEDQDDARVLEAWMNDKIYENDLNERHAYDLTYYVTRDSYAIMYCGWKQEYQQCYLTQYRDKNADTDDLIPTKDALEEDGDYETVEVPYDEATADGLDIRVCNTLDVYFWPPNAPSIEASTRIAERIWLSDHELLDGIEDYGYDEDAVHEILSAGSKGATGQRKENDERDGTGDSQQNAGDYECFLVIGRPPVCMDQGKPLLNDEKRRRDYVWLFEASTRKVFRFDLSPLKTRPYVKFTFLAEPGRMLGDGVCSLLQMNQLEGSIAGRFRIDVRDWAMSPGLMVPMEMYDDFKRFGRYPGAIYAVPQGVSPAAVVPLVGDKDGFSAGMQDSMFFQQRSAQLFSSQARGAVTNKERTAEEVGNSAAGADAKTDLFLVGIHIGQKDLARVIMSHERQFMSEDGVTAFVQNKVLRIKPELLEKKFRISASGNSETANPELQRRTAEALYQFVLSNPIIQMQVQRGDMSGLYEASTAVLRSLRVRDVQNVLGPEPAKPPSAEMILEVVVAAIQQYAASGDENMGMLLQQVQQIMSSQVPPDAGGPTEEETESLPWEQDGFGMMGAGMQGPESYGLPPMMNPAMMGAPMVQGAGMMM